MLVTKGVLPGETLITTVYRRWEVHPAVNSIVV